MSDGERANRLVMGAEGKRLTYKQGAVLDVIEAEMRDAPDRLQWAMNHCLAQIGIEHAGHRTRALDIGERLEVLKDYPTPGAGCHLSLRPRLDR